MSSYHTPWQAVLICLCILGQAPISKARQANDEVQYKEAVHKDVFSKQQDKESTPEQPKSGGPQKQREQKAHKEPREIKERYRTAPTVRKPPLAKAAPIQHERKAHKDRNRHTPTEREQQRHNSHDRHYKRYSKKRYPHHYHRHENYRYHTRYLAPIQRHYHPWGYRFRSLPHGYIRIVVGSLPYFYFGGMFYQHHSDGYIVVGAPIDAEVNVLPFGFIEFSLDNFTYYYVNNTYYLWDDYREAYVVVEKPAGADKAIAKATAERLFVYPNEGQSEEQQAKDRYECHRWAVHETGVDPSLNDETNLSYEDNHNYKRALSACLEGRGYTVK